jgi:hypothetical protein
MTEITTPTFDFKSDAVADTNLDMVVGDAQ